jgi:anti-anti-sigma factor
MRIQALASFWQRSYLKISNQKIDPIFDQFQINTANLRFNNEHGLVKKNITKLEDPMVGRLDIEELAPKTKNDFFVIRLSGRLDETTAPSFQKVLSAHYKEHNVQIIVDFAQIDYLSSFGLRVMNEANNNLNKVSGRICFCAVQERVFKIIQVAGFDKTLFFFDSVLSAKNALKQK